MITGVKKLRISDNVERQTAPRILVQEVDGSVGYVAKDSIGSGSGIGGTQYSYVAGKGTPTQNGTELQNAYNLAKAIVGLSATNRYKIIVGSGKYEFTDIFQIDTQYIDFVSLTGDSDVEFTSGINVITNDVYLRGLKTETSFTIGDNLSLLKCENCVGGYVSFGGNVTASGIFINCIAGSFSFGGYGTASGTFINCSGGTNSFGGNGMVSGKLFYCILREGIFSTVSSGGRTYYCIDGNGNPNNQ